MSRRHMEHELCRHRETLSLSEIEGEAPVVVDDWCDNQHSLNLAVSRILQHQQQQHQQQSGKQEQQQHEIKVVQTFRLHNNATLSLHPLWKALVGCTNVSSLCLIGVQLDARASGHLARALRCPQTRLHQLQVCARWYYCLESGLAAKCPLATVAINI
jgi:hypothetical protein